MKAGTISYCHNVGDCLPILAYEQGCVKVGPHQSAFKIFRNYFFKLNSLYEKNEEKRLITHSLYSSILNLSRRFSYLSNCTILSKKIIWKFQICVMSSIQMFLFVSCLLSWLQISCYFFVPLMQLCPWSASITSKSWCVEFFSHSQIF